MGTHELIKSMTPMPEHNIKEVLLRLAAHRLGNQTHRERSFRNIDERQDAAERSVCLFPFIKNRARVTLIKLLSSARYG